MTELIIECIVIYAAVTFTYCVCSGIYAGHHYFNPLCNYEEWDGLNIFGVLLFTMLLNILFAPVAIMYWVIKILVFIFTVGRK